MKKILSILIPLALVAMVVVKLKSNKDTVEERVFHYDKEAPIPVQVYTVSAKSMAGESQLTGVFEAESESKLSAETQGKVERLLVDVGSEVKKGQALIQLDVSLLQLQLQAVEVQIEGLEADVARYTILTEADAVQGVKLEKAQLGLKAAQIQRSTLQEQVSKSTIRAPFAGVVTMKMTERGAFAAPGMPLLQLTDISSLRFTVNVPESELPLFRPDQEQRIYVNALQGKEFIGKTDLIGSKGNMANSYPIQFSVKNTAEQEIKSGMFGKVSVSRKSNAETLIIPASAIIGSSVQPQVYLVHEGKAVLHDVQLGSRMGDQVQVSSGLTAGDEIISSGFINLFDGANVQFDKQGS